MTLFQVKYYFESDGKKAHTQKSLLMRELENFLNAEDYYYSHEQNSVFIIDVMV